MKILIFMLGLLVFTAGQANPVERDLIDRINALKHQIKSISSEIKTVKNTELPKLSKKIMRIAESNKLVIQAREELKNNAEKESTKKCRRLFKENLESLVDQIYVRVSDRLTLELTKIDKDLRKINIELDRSKKHLESGSAHVGKVEKELRESARSVNRLKIKVPVLVPSALDVVKKNTIRELAQQNILNPVTDCLANPDDQPSPTDS